MSIWIVDETDDGRVELIAPNGLSLFTVSRETAGMIGRMLSDVAEEDDDGQ